MRSYIPNTDEQQKQMLQAIGVPSLDGLFAGIPDNIKLHRPLNLPGPLSELEVARELETLALMNNIRPGFLGAGAYNHFIPAVVGSVISRGEFLTAYTPYHPEMSQGLLQAIFEYQSLICILTGLESSNASVYDGATAAAEAMLMMLHATNRKKVLLSEALHPDVMAVLKTYARSLAVELVTIGCKDGVSDISALNDHAQGAAGYIAACPNFFGVVEDMQVFSDAIHAGGGLFTAYVNPISLGLLKCPGEYGADIAVGEGQPLGLPLSFGGPYLGFMAATSKLMRNLPGRIVGETVDGEGNRAFVLTLQAREQHIRRERASSSICSNQALCALAAAVYLSAMGPQGLREVAGQCYQKAHYMHKKLAAVKGMQVSKAPFFNEFILYCDAGAQKVNEALKQIGITGGFELAATVEGQEGILFCVTELNTKRQIDEAAACLEAL